MSIDLDTNGVPPGAAAATSPHDPAAPATGERKRRSMSPRGRKMLFAAAGALGMVISILGFVLTSEALDNRVAVLVSARDIAAGETLGAADFAEDLAEMSGIPHVAWTPEAPFSFDGLVAVHAIPAGSPVLFDMVIAPATEPVGNELEFIVPLNTSLETSELGIGDTVLLIDPGVAPTLDADGRPRSVFRTMELRDFDGGGIRLLLEPAEWGEWRELLRSLGDAPLVRKVPLGGDAEEFRAGLEAVWASEWQGAVDAAAALRPPPEPTPEPGQLEARITLDSSLATSEVRNGDRVLLVDPGVEPDDVDDGRPRSVIFEMTLEGYHNGIMQLFVSPEDWVQWRALPTRLGAAPMVLPIPEGTDVEELRDRLDLAWTSEWHAKIELLGLQNAPPFDGTFAPGQTSQSEDSQSQTSQSEAGTDPNAPAATEPGSPG